MEILSNDIILTQILSKIKREKGEKINKNYNVKMVKFTNYKYNETGYDKIRRKSVKKAKTKGKKAGMFYCFMV